jgi:hypothetical protein
MTRTCCCCSLYTPPAREGRAPLLSIPVRRALSRLASRITRSGPVLNAFRAGCRFHPSPTLFEDRFVGIRRSALISTPAGRHNSNIKSRGEQCAA